MNTITRSTRNSLIKCKRWLAPIVLVVFAVPAWSVTPAESPVPTKTKAAQRSKRAKRSKALKPAAPAQNQSSETETKVEPAPPTPRDADKNKEATAVPSSTATPKTEDNTESEVASQDLPEVRLNYETWAEFSNDVKKDAAQNKKLGIAYLISGGVATIGGIVGYNNSRDPFAKAVFLAAQSIGIGAIGYGGVKAYSGTNQSLFYALDSNPTLSNNQRDQIIRSYFDFRRGEEKSIRVIRAITHGIITVLNGYNGYFEPNGEIRTALFFVAGVNALATVSLLF